MAIIEFGSIPPIYNVDKSNVVNFLVGPLNIFGGGGEGYRLKKGSGYIHIIVWQTQFEISASCEENKDQK